MMLTPYHAKYFAHNLTRQLPSGSPESVARVLSGAKVDLQPHQVDAALFALRSPFSNGAILADEVGLGKTIEAGLLLSQLWADQQRRLLIVCPASLRNQWRNELDEKFSLPSVVLHSSAPSSEDLFLQPAPVICSYQFAHSNNHQLAKIAWDLVIIDEAHKLRNLGPQARAIKAALSGRRKLLLTATPLQNRLPELHALISFIDERAFGDLRTFNSRFGKYTSNTLPELKERLEPFCKRTLRQHVTEYIRFTERVLHTQDFEPSAAEQQLYDLVSNYLRRPHLFALPELVERRALMTMVLRKLLASSTFAIAGTLRRLAHKLHIQAAKIKQQNRGCSKEVLAEASDLAKYAALAESIHENAKGRALLTALRQAFEKAESAQRKNSPATFRKKAVIFTESRRTQAYIARILERTEYADRFVLFSGSNNDDRSKAIYRRWLEAHAGSERVSGVPASDRRAAIVDYFRSDADIMVATEAAAEGLNLQFCNLVVNYDLPWNPQRIEQRIGRCHRYGQRFDVVVVNFLNQRNAADQRVYELLTQKFRLFEGVFGASDEVLGSIAEGVDIEGRIANLYQNCRSAEEIEAEWNCLQQDLAPSIESGKRQAYRHLLENFSPEVLRKVKLDAEHHRTAIVSRLWALTADFLAKTGCATIDDSGFTLNRNPFPNVPIDLGRYRRSYGLGGGRLLGVHEPLTQAILKACRKAETPTTEVLFDLSGKRNSAELRLIGSSGWLCCATIRLRSFETEEHVVLGAINDRGQSLSQHVIDTLFDAPGETKSLVDPPIDIQERLDAEIEHSADRVVQACIQRNQKILDQEVKRLEGWLTDEQKRLERQVLEPVNKKLREAKKEATDSSVNRVILEASRRIGRLYMQRESLWKQYDREWLGLQDEVDSELRAMAAKLRPTMEREILFTIRWRVV